MPQIPGARRDLPESLIASFFSGAAPSRREHRAEADAVRSMGIGLSVCRSIIRAHGGEMKAEKSIRHGGVKISFTLPLEKETE